MRKIYFILTLLNIIPILNATEINFPEVKGYTLDKRIDQFDGTSLFNQINGAAAVYLDYGFVEMQHAVYHNDTDDSYIVAEAYRHKNPDYAYGIYALERTGSDQFTNIGAQAYTEEGLLNAYGGDWYIKLYTHRKDAETAKAMNTIAAGLEKELFANATLPIELSWFPTEEKMKGTELFVVKDVLGQSFLSEAYTATYDNGNYELYLFKKETPAEIETMISKYCEWAKTTPDNANKEIIAINDRYNGTIFIAPKNNYAAIIVGVENEEKAKTLLTKILSQIP